MRFCTLNVKFFKKYVFNLLTSRTPTIFAGILTLWTHTNLSPSLKSVFGLESLISRLVQSEKCEFTTVNDHFEGKHNEDSGLYRQTLITILLKNFLIISALRQ